MLIHCDHHWNALGLSTDFRTLTKAKARAERIYPGLMGAWKKTGVTRIQAKRYLDKQGQRCGSCDKAWYEVEAMVELSPRRGKPTLALCGYCIDDLYRQLHE